MGEREESLHEEQKAEVENRMRNLLWTVSGDYGLDTELDIASFQKAKDISIYDAIKKGAFARYFDTEAFGLYLVKKIYLGAEEAPLVGIAQLCADSASIDRLTQERPGVPDIQRSAFESILEHDFRRMNESFQGRMKIAYMRSVLSGEEHAERRIAQELSKIKSLKGSRDTMEIIRCVDEIYNRAIDRGFERRVGNLEKVLSISVSELKDYDWQDYLREEAEEARLEEYVRQMQNNLTRMLEEDSEEKEKRSGGVILLDQEAVDKMYSYMELNYGRSYLSEKEQEQKNRRLCRGAHSDCSLYYTDGILKGLVKVNAQSELAARTKEMNLRFYRQHRRITRQNIEVLSAILKRALVARNEDEEFLSEYGKIVPNRLWRLGRTSEKKLFLRTIHRESSDFAVEVLIDASGSQRNRTSQVALQGYILSEALSNAGIPHQVMGFCSFWDYTVMRRFRDYDEDASANEQIFEFYASANNRDGLAVRAAGDSLDGRPEEHKILIVLSDGRPNDIIVNRPNSKNPTPYFGDYAVKDTAYEVRKLRNRGIAVLGVFAGEEKDLGAERRIFGKDFAYIREIENFSHVVGRYLRKQIID